MGAVFVLSTSSALLQIQKTIANAYLLTIARKEISKRERREGRSRPRGEWGQLAKHRSLRLMLYALCAKHMCFFRILNSVYQTIVFTTKP